MGGRGGFPGGNDDRRRVRRRERPSFDMRPRRKRLEHSSAAVVSSPIKSNEKSVPFAAAFSGKTALNFRKNFSIFRAGGGEGRRGEGRKTSSRALSRDFSLLFPRSRKTIAGKHVAISGRLPPERNLLNRYRPETEVRKGEMERNGNALNTGKRIRNVSEDEKESSLGWEKANLHFTDLTL